MNGNGTAVAAEGRWHELAEQWVHLPSAVTATATAKSTSATTAAAAARRANPDLVLQLYSLLDSDAFLPSSVAQLDSLQLLEKLLWPQVDDDTSDQHAILIAALFAYKQEARSISWPLFTAFPASFSTLVRRLISLSLDHSLSTPAQTTILRFFTAAFQSLEQDIVRKECAPLVSIGIWDHLHSDVAREAHLNAVPARRKAWKSNNKRFQAADSAAQARFRIDRAWLYNLVLKTCRNLTADRFSKSLIILATRTLEFLVDLVSQLPTRRYTIVLLDDLNLLSLLKSSPLYTQPDGHLYRDLVALFEHFCRFHVDDAGQVLATRASRHRDTLLALQSAALHHFPDSLKVLGLSNLAVIANPDELQPLLGALSTQQLETLCSALNLRTTYPASAVITVDKTLLLNFLLAHVTSIPDVHNLMQQLPVLPTEESIYDQSLIRNDSYDSTQPLALPKFNLQYLALSDFLWRAFRLQQAEALFEIRKDLELVVRKMKPQPSRDLPSNTHFTGFSKMAISIDKPAIIEVLPPSVGELVPSQVRAEVVLDVRRLGDSNRAEWDALKPKDVVFLLAVKPQPQSTMSDKTQSALKGSHTGISYIRSAEVAQVLDDKGRPLRSGNLHHSTGQPRTRRLLLNLDAQAFHRDTQALAAGKPDIYKSINLIARRPARENNFRSLLESVKDLTARDVQLPSWLQPTFLGYGQPSASTYPSMDQKVARIDFLDTFLSWQHLTDAFPNRDIRHEHKEPPLPPYTLQLSNTPSDIPSQNPKKRRRDQIDELGETAHPITVSCSTEVGSALLVSSDVRTNKIPFTSKQTQALMTASQPGLSLIVGPPGTGKTDVAAQLMNILYHNFQKERILLVAHSNQALNQLFAKIVALDIDPRHLLRLGHGEEDLETESSFSKHGRVESFFELRQQLLTEVNILSASLALQGAFGDSCETASYFNQTHIQPAWTNFWALADNSDTTAHTVYEAFPFHSYLSHISLEKVLPSSAPVEHVRQVAKSCQEHIDKIFTRLESIRPFEVLRNPRDQTNHLLVNEARIIAMTSTHAAIKRAEIASLGFHYDTLIMEEAAQVTEIESFIPCAMQNVDPKSGELPLKRIVLVGDHLQNSPIVQNFALRDYSRLEQSLFLRLIRLGVPHVVLDAQGRCRPSMTQLFNWRYPELHNLPHITALPEFARANAGFRHEFQFINVEDYQGDGEREPSPHFIQNLGEAEYAVALFQYMRLLGYSADSISILAAYAGQKALIRDVLDHRCKNNKLFGLPKIVTTIDKYQGEQNDYIILSMTRTKSVGYLRDVRRLTVALSRARLGLYVLGRRALMEDLPGFDVLCQKGNTNSHLEVVTGEMFPSQRGVVDDVPSVEIHNLEHMGQFVYEMTQAKVADMGQTFMTSMEGPAEVDTIIEDEEQVAQEVDAEMNPLMETL